MVRKLALLVAVHVHELGVVTEIDADPPEAANVVVVVPVMIWQPDGPVAELSLQLVAKKRKAIAQSVASARREIWRMSMPPYVAQITPIHLMCAVQLRENVLRRAFAL